MPIAIHGHVHQFLLTSVPYENIMFGTIHESWNAFLNELGEDVLVRLRCFDESRPCDVDSLFIFETLIDGLIMIALS